MKRFLYYTLLCCASVALGACTQSDELDSIQMDGGKITISTSLDGQVVTRAADNAIERTVKHIDVFVVKSEGSDAGSVVHYERSTNGNNGGSAADGAGQLTLSIGRASEKFAVDAKYTFYLVANATISETDAAAMTTLSALEDWTQSEAIENAGLMSSWMHVTGTQLGGNATPDVFLMQAIAGDAAGQVVNSSANNGESLSLSASLERAAAKIVVNISQGENVSFYENLTQGEERGSSLYYFNMLPVKSYVLSGQTLPLAQQQLVTTVDLGPNESTGVWTAQDGSTAENPKHKIQVVGYAYAHSWGEIDPQDATALVLNIPIKWDKNGDSSDGNEFAACNSWYKIPLSKQMKFERNKCYQVDVVINTAGADDRSSVIELEGVEFATLPWMDVDITVGTTDRPKYLTLNTDVVKIYNANSDDSQLIFSSSSPITAIRLKDIDDEAFSSEYRGDGYLAYYKNKYSQIVGLSNAIQQTISATAPNDALNGPITIVSPIIPASQEEIDAQIAALVAPVYPDVTAPTEPAGRPATPDVVEQPKTPVKPHPDDYKPADTVPGNNSTTRTNYRYTIATNGIVTFEKQTGTREWEGVFIFGQWSDWEYSAWTADTETQREWDTALAQYNSDVATYDERLEAYNTYINVTLPAYNSQLAAWQSTAEYQSYQALLTAYQTAINEYNTKKAAYDAAVAQIMQQAGGEETHYNTIRYLEFEVENEQGLTADFRVEQYPLVYITNIVGWYSYRDDFIGGTATEPTTYLEKRGSIVGVSYDEMNNDEVVHEYHTSSSGFWRSKVNRDVTRGTNGAPNQFSQTQRSYDIDYYNWGGNTVGHSNAENGNARMYHVRVTATSGRYTVARPKIVNASGVETTDVESGFTEASAANSTIVSPSFMIASRLGFINSGSGNITFGNNATTLAVAREHCMNYVEVAADGRVFDDWRLPTAAEIGIILDLQSGSDDNSNAAIDYLLNAAYYFSASGPIANSQNKTSGTAIRCIRDAYDVNDR